MNFHYTAWRSISTISNAHPHLLIQLKRLNITAKMPHRFSNGSNPNTTHITNAVYNIVIVPTPPHAYIIHKLLLKQSYITIHLSNRSHPVYRLALFSIRSAILFTWPAFNQCSSYSPLSSQVIFGMYANCSFVNSISI